MKYIILITTFILTSCSVNLDSEKFSLAYSNCQKLMEYMNGKVDKVVYQEGNFYCKGAAPDPVLNEQDLIDRDIYSLKDSTVDTMLFTIELIKDGKLKIEEYNESINISKM